MEPATPTPRNASQTKARILAAAQQAFAQSGYSQTGIRDIAEMVGVSSTILLRYFGTKAGLFEAALTEIMDVGMLIPQDRAQFGRTVADLLLHPDLNISPHAMITLATGDADAREIAIRALRQHALAPLADWLGPPDAEARAMQVISLCTAFVLYTYQLTVLPADGGADPKMVEWLVKSLQAVADQ